MLHVEEHIEAKKTDAVLVTGGSAGGFGSALLADDVFDYFPHASHLAVAVDAGLMVSEKWRDAAVNRWHAPKEICDRLKSTIAAESVPGEGTVIRIGLGREVLEVE